MDVKPEDISPDIIEVARHNPICKQQMTIYLSGVPVKDGEPLTYQDTLELMVLKLAEQYSGALEGWQEQSRRTEEAIGKNIPKFPQPLLVDENPVVQSPIEAQLEIAKGMLGKMISPARRAWATAGGRETDFPPLQLSRSFIEQVEALLGGNIDAYIQKNPCPVCFSTAWIITDGQPLCAVCEANKAKRAIQHQRQMFVKKLSDALASDVDLVPLLTQFLSEYRDETTKVPPIITPSLPV